MARPRAPFCELCPTSLSLSQRLMKPKSDKLKLAGQYRERVYKIVHRIPKGRVMTYGQIAYMLGEGYTPRTVGFVMHGADDQTPWHRVINSQGRCSTGGIVLPADKQQRMLEREGIKFDDSGRCDLEKVLWRPRGAQPRDKVTRPRTVLYRR